MSNKSKPLIITAAVLAAIAAFIYFQNKSSAPEAAANAAAKAQPAVVIAYQTGVDPSKVAQANGDYEKAKLSIGNWNISILWCEKQAIYDFANKKLDIFNTYMHKIKNHTKEIAM